MSHSPNIIQGIADSRCSDHYASINADVHNIQPAGDDAVRVTLPDGTIIKSIHMATM